MLRSSVLILIASTALAVDIQARDATRVVARSASPSITLLNPANNNGYASPVATLETINPDATQSRLNCEHNTSASEMACNSSRNHQSGTEAPANTKRLEGRRVVFGTTEVVSLVSVSLQNEAVVSRNVSSGSMTSATAISPGNDASSALPSGEVSSVASYPTRTTEAPSSTLEWVTSRIVPTSTAGAMGRVQVMEGVAMAALIGVAGLL